MYKRQAYDRGRVLTEKLRGIIPRQMFEVPIQAAIGGRVLARETVKADRKSTRLNSSHSAKSRMPSSA